MRYLSPLFEETATGYQCVMDGKAKEFLPGRLHRSS